MTRTLPLLALLLSGLATAAPAPELTHVQSVKLDVPILHDSTARAEELDAVWLIAIRTGSDGAIQRAMAQPLLQLGAAPVRVLAASVDRGCVVGFVPRSVDPATAPLLWGPAALPEQLDPAEAAAAALQAREAGARGLGEPHLRAVLAPELQLPADGALLDAARALARTCGLP